METLDSFQKERENPPNPIIPDEPEQTEEEVAFENRNIFDEL
jgi:hypothetical protein